jgi:exopolysaccharide biosynthesis polyprenyl glycosylphosphotransferase
MLQTKTAREKKQRPVLLVGAPQNVIEMLNTPKAYLRSRDKLVGALPLSQGQPLDDRRHCVFAADTPFADILHSHSIEEVIFAPDMDCLQRTSVLLRKCEEEGVPSRVVLPFYERSVAATRTEIIAGKPVIAVVPAARKSWQLVVKRAIDVAGATIGLLLLSPFLIIMAALVKATSRGPVFYRWRVAGQHNRPIVSYKFRTMVENADALKEELLRNNEMGGVVFKMKDDPRVTPLGKFLRKYSIDELPQLWSVLKGDLSLVGPRPPLQKEVAAFADWHRRKLSVKPGLTCLWQINGRNRIKDFDHWVKLDLEYIDHWSLRLDMKILFKTIPAVLRGSGM